MGQSKTKKTISKEVNRSKFKLLTKKSNTIGVSSDSLSRKINSHFGGMRSKEINSNNNSNNNSNSSRENSRDGDSRDGHHHILESDFMKNFDTSLINPSSLKSSSLKTNKYYPSISKKSFHQDIATHPLFKKYVYPDSKELFTKLHKKYISNEINTSDGEKVDMGNHFNLSFSQKFLRNFMSPHTPYRGLFVIHGTGVGKTCTGLTIAEALKDFVHDNHAKITIIRADEFKREVFEMNTLKTEKYQDQCTGDVYLKDESIQSMLDGCNSKNTENCDRIKKKIEKNVKHYYNFTTPMTWANNLSKTINSRVKNLSGKEREEKIKAIIQKKYNNNVLIIDEAHNLRDGDTHIKILPPMLNTVLKHSQNLRLILLSATPMFDKPNNIISLLNYLLINDNRPTLDKNKIFNPDGTLKRNGESLLAEGCKGYISYMRGNNPSDFPIRITAKENIPTKMLDLSRYPTLNIHGTHKINDKIKYLDLVDCPFGKYQKQIFNQYLKTLQQDDSIKQNSNDDGDSSRDDSSKGDSSRDDKLSMVEFSHSVADSNELQISNFIYQNLDEVSGNMMLCYGDKGLDQIVSKIPGKMTYRFKDDSYHKRFELPELKNWGTKIGSIVENVQKAKGPVFIYASYKASGVIPLAFALEMVGYRRYKQYSTPLLEDNNKNKTYKGDYIIYTGDEQLSAYAKHFIDMRKGMIKEDKVKIFIGSRKASEGLNLYGFREVHILDPWHNMSVLDQSIGRAIRRGSHDHLPPQERNVSVYLYASTLNDKRESIDLKIYRASENKAINTGVVETILKKNAIDCYFTLNINKQDPKIFNKKIPLVTSTGKKINIDLSDHPLTKSCLYMKNCDYKCANIDVSKLNKVSKYADIPLMYVNIEKEVQEYQRKIIHMLGNQYNLNLNYLTEYLKLTSLEDKKIFYTVIETMVNSGLKFKDKQGRNGTCVLNGDFIRFVPETNIDPNISLQKQHANLKDGPKMIDLSGLINKIKKERHAKLDYVIDDYKEVITMLFSQMDELLYTTLKQKRKTNIKCNSEEVLELLFDRMTYHHKRSLLRELFSKANKGVELANEEKTLLPILKKYAISYQQLFGESLNIKYYAFILMKFDKLTVEYYDDKSLTFVSDNGLLKKVIKLKLDILKKKTVNKLYGYLAYKGKNKEAVFKITDLIQKGDKKSVKGFKCLDGQSQDIKKYIKMISSTYFSNFNGNFNKKILCNDLELLLKIKNNEGGKIYFFTPEEYYIKEYQQ